ncbi:MAG: bamB [Actinomycetia bacterium]|jgi:outer membrane protein assembly factor BamB|nr:bamB [Actinomycetes bacterium]
MVLGLPLVALADWPQFQGGPSHDGLSDGPSAPFEVAWRHGDIAIEDADVTGGLSSPIVADDGTIVVVGPHEVLAIDGEDRSEVFSVERDLGPSVPAAIGEGADGPVVVFAEGFGDRGPSPSASATASSSASPSAHPEEEDDVDSHLVAIDLRTGEPVWTPSVPLEDVVVTPIAADEDAAYAGDLSGHVTAVELSSGDVRWSADLGSSIAGAVTIDEDRALVATQGQQQIPGTVVALDRSTGEELWRSPEDVVRGNLVSAPVVADGRILVLEPGSVVALDPTDGRLVWRTEIINPIAPPFSPQAIAALAPVSADGMVFVVDVTGRAYGLDAETGVELWDQALNDPSPLTPAVLTDAHLLVPTNSGALYAVDRTTGHLAFRFDTGGTFLRGLADAGEVLVGVTGVDDGEIVALGEDPDGVLTDEPSPTTVDLGKLLAGFALGVIPTAIVAVTLARPLQRRLGPKPTPIPASDDHGEVG